MLALRMQRIAPLVESIARNTRLRRKLCHRLSLPLSKRTAWRLNSAVNRCLALQHLRGCPHCQVSVKLGPLQPDPFPSGARSRRGVRLD